MILKYDLISIVGSGYQSKWCSIRCQNKIVFLAAKDYAVLCKKLTAKIETPKTIFFDSKTRSMLYNHVIEVRSNINCWKWISIKMMWYTTNALMRSTIWSIQEMESYMLKYVGRWFETCHQQFILHYFRVLHSSNKPQHIKKMKPEIFPNKPR